MKVLALVYPGMTLLDLVGPIQAWSFLPGYEVQYAWHRFRCSAQTAVSAFEICRRQTLHVHRNAGTVSFQESDFDA